MKQNRTATQKFFSRIRRNRVRRLNRDQRLDLKIAVMYAEMSR